MAILTVSFHGGDYFVNKGGDLMQLIEGVKLARLAHIVDMFLRYSQGHVQSEQYSICFQLMSLCAPHVSKLYFDEIEKELARWTQILESRRE